MGSGAMHASTQSCTVMLCISELPYVCQLWMPLLLQKLGCALRAALLSASDTQAPLVNPLGE